MLTAWADIGNGASPLRDFHPNCALVYICELRVTRNLLATDEYMYMATKEALSLTFVTPEWKTELNQCSMTGKYVHVSDRHALSKIKVIDIMQAIW